MKIRFFEKCLFIEDENILVFGDIHLGYEKGIIKQGVSLPNSQINVMKEEFKLIFKKIKKNKVNKIIILGDLKHSFSFKWYEKEEFNIFIKFLQKYVNKEDIILIKGNHDNANFTEGIELRDYYKHKNVLFLHGHKNFKIINNKEINYLILGHLHPSVMLEDEQKIKRERFKCFLKGKYKNKDFIIVPSFLGFISGVILDKQKEFRCIIPKKELSESEVYIVNNKKVFNFGKLNYLDNQEDL